ncbi:DinB family protein [Marinobacter sp. M1N3S26]|uniref:DinB family protein n=1 Tax=Marinobacter sp. M1N3S26 TaxID=3382299 RepID=UPI00387AC0E4
MSQVHLFQQMAAYNQWMNGKVYEAAGRLDPSELSRDRGAFFGSILGTLNHIVVGDTLWLKRFATLPSGTESLQKVAAQPTPTSLDQILFDDLGKLRDHRRLLDDEIVRWVGGLKDSGVDQALAYRTIEGQSSNKRLSYLIQHFFNHQTHHRGQVSTLLSQAGEDIGVTDLLALIPDES